MKNFVFACLVFLIWAFFGAWIHNKLHPQKKKSVDVILPKPIPVVVVKDTLIVKPVIKDSVLKITAKPVEKVFPKQIIFYYSEKKDFAKDNSILLFTKALKTFLKENEEAQVHVVGHTDTIGAKEDNYGVGLERAKNFKTFLISKGINKHRIHVSSKGETEPLPENDTYLNKKTNRRIEITVKYNTND